MKISTKGRYALEAVTDLVLHAGDQYGSIRGIAQRRGLSDNYLEQLFLQLRRAGLVESVRGPQGGYRLARDPSAVSAGDVLRAAEGSLEREFEKAVERLRAAQKAQREARAKHALQALLDAALDGAKDEALNEAERRELSAARARDVTRESHEDALLGLELDAGIDSPADAAARRRELQMQRLAERMGSGSSRPDARTALLAWAAHAKQADAAQNARAARALKALLG